MKNLRHDQIGPFVHEIPTTFVTSRPSFVRFPLVVSGSSPQVFEHLLRYPSTTFSDQNTAGTYRSKGANRFDVVARMALAGSQYRPINAEAQSAHYSRPAG